MRVPLTSNAACAATCGMRAARACRRPASASCSAAAARRSSGRAASASANSASSGVGGPRCRVSRPARLSDSRARSARPSGGSSSARAIAPVAVGLNRALLEIGDVHGEAEDVGVGHHPGVAAALGAAEILPRGVEAGIHGPARGAGGDDAPERLGRRERNARRGLVRASGAAMFARSVAASTAARRRPPSKISCSTPALARKKPIGSG